MAILPAQHPRLARGVVLALLVLVSAFAALSSPAPAAAAEPCWKTLIKDWYDGRIDKTYPLECYRDALDELPPDVEAYSSARDDIRRALLAAVRAGRKTVPPQPATQPPPASESPDDEGDDVVAAPGGGSSDGGREDDDGGPFSPVADVFAPSDADSVPVPLLVLAGVALLLLAAGATTFVTRRIQARRVPVATPPGNSDG
jgi:hypothetical protein